MVHTEDVTARRLAEARLREQALRDSLPGLPNRTLFHDRLQEASTQSSQRFALMVLDLDRFKDVNDALGHHVGDQLLQQVGPRLQSALREQDTVARLGGDEFGVLLPRADGAEAEAVAEKLVRVLTEPFLVGDVRLDVGGSFGIALYPDHGSDAQALLQRADVAMYLAKRENRGVATYRPDQDSSDPDRLALWGDLRHAVERRELQLYYQPKYACADGELVGVVALVRWL